MAKSRVQEGLSPKLYLLLLAIASFLSVTALGGGLFHVHSFHPYHEWTHRLFHGLCHQMPDRSLVLNGTVTAVCSRCLGIYGGFNLGLLLFLPVHWLWPRRNNRAAVKLIVAALAVIAVDVAGNLLGLWMNTHLSRILTGLLLGLSLSWLLTGEFEFNKNLKS